MYPQFEVELARLKAELDKSSCVTYDSVILAQFIRDGFTRKSTLAQALGLGPDHRKVVLKAGLNQDGVPDEVYDRLIYPLELLVAFGKGLDSNLLRVSIPENSASYKDPKNYQRLTRVLKRILNKHAPARVQELEQAATAFYDYVSKTKRAYAISVNPLDFILASDAPYCGFSSCYGLDGEHLNGTLAYIRDTQTAMLFDIGKESEGQAYPFFKHGRAWAYFGEHLDRFLIGKGYGTLHSADKAIAGLSDEMSTALAAHLKIDNQWKASRSLQFPSGVENAYVENAGGRHSDMGHTKFAVYFDVEASRYVVHKSLVEEERVCNVALNLSFEDARCMVCGEETDNGGGLACKKHSNGCGSCGRFLAGNSYLVIFNYEGDEEEWCGRCTDEHTFSCSGCENTFCDVVDWVCCEDEGGTYCKNCADELLTRCAECRGYFSGVEESPVDDRYRCDDCHESHLEEYPECGRCDNRAEADSMVRVHAHGFLENWCPTCVVEHATACEACGDLSHDDELTGGVCPSCTPVAEPAAA